MILEPSDVLSKYGLSIQPAPLGDDDAQYMKIVKVRHLPPAENNGMHNLFMDVLGLDGKRIQGAKLTIINANGRQVTAIIDKPPNEPGTNVPISKEDSLRAYVAGIYPSEMIVNVHARHPDEAPGNTLYHHSFLVVWQVTPRQAATDPTTPPADDSQWDTVWMDGNYRVQRKKDD